MLSGRLTDAIADRKSGGELSWTVIAVIGVVVAVGVPALIALGTGAWSARPDVQASEPAPEIERANANDRPSVGAVPRQTASDRSAYPEPPRRFAESSEPGRPDSAAATRGGSGGSIPSPPAMPAPEPRSSAPRLEPEAPVPDPSTFARVAAEEALASAAAAEALAPSIGPESAPVDPENAPVDPENAPVDPESLPLRWKRRRPRLP